VRSATPLNMHAGAMPDPSPVLYSTGSPLRPLIDSAGQFPLKLLRMAPQNRCDADVAPFTACPDWSVAVS